MFAHLTLRDQQNQINNKLEEEKKLREKIELELRNKPKIQELSLEVDLNKLEQNNRNNLIALEEFKRIIQEEQNKLIEHRKKEVEEHKEEIFRLIEENVKLKNQNEELMNRLEQIEEKINKLSIKEKTTKTKFDSLKKILKK